MSGGLVAAAMCVAVACGKSPNATTKSPTSAAPASEPAAPSVGSSPAPATPAATSAPASPATALPTAPLILHTLAPGAFEIENQSAAPVSIAWSVDIEWLNQGTWTARPSMGLNDKCPITYPDPECKTLAPGARWRPLPWTGWFGCTQCMSCDKNVPAGPGTYRFAVSLCNSSTRVLSEPIVHDSPKHFAGTPCDADCKALQKSFDGK